MFGYYRYCVLYMRNEGGAVNECLYREEFSEFKQAYREFVRLGREINNEYDVVRLRVLLMAPRSGLYEIASMDVDGLRASNAFYELWNSA